jgi:hypothetical protein
MNKSSNILIENKKEKEQLYEEMIEGYLYVEQISHHLL